MTIEIHKPELEALIAQRMESGRYPTVEDALIQALKASPLQSDPAQQSKRFRTSDDLIAAMQSSPYRELEIEPARHRPPVRDVSL